MTTSAKISKGGQISIPAQVRRRWGAKQVLLEDQGDALVIRPLPDDPFRAALGSLRLPDGITSEGMRAQAREEEAEAEDRKWGLL